MSVSSLGAAFPLATPERAAAADDVPRERLWRRLGYACGITFALGIGYFLARMPLQISENLGSLLEFQTSSLRQQVIGHLNSAGYMRPLMWGQQKLLFDLANGHYFATYRIFHVAQFLALAVLFVRLLDVRTARDVALVPFGLVVLGGMHTFDGTVREAFPVNHFMTILVCCLLAVNLSRSRGGWWIDAAAVALFAYALFTVETGVLVGVCLAGAYLLGLRGVSARGVLGAAGVLAVYLYLRFGPFDVGTPGLLDRSSGFGFSVREPSDLIRMFGDQPLWFYAYNVVCSILTVLWSEPRAGVWVFTRSLLAGSVPPWLIINFVSSTLATLLLARFVFARAPAWRRRDFEDADRLVLLFSIVLLVNAGMSYPYTKDVIMSPAGAFYAVAVFIGARHALHAIDRRRLHGWVAGAVAVALLATSAAWSMRALGLAYAMRYTAFTNRNEWATGAKRMDRARPGWRDPASLALVGKLRTEALAMPVPNPYFAQRWLEPYFDPR